MTPQELRERTRRFARSVVQFLGSHPLRAEAADGARQLRRAASAVAANYRAAGRARSHREFTSKIALVLEEADEALHWLEFLQDCGFAEGPEIRALTAEAAELTAIFGASYRTARAREHAEKAAPRAKVPKPGKPRPE